MKVKASDISLPPCPTFHPLSVPVHPHGGCYPGDFLLMGRKRKSGDTRGTQDRKFWHISFPALPHVSLCNSHRHAGFCQNPLYHDHNRAAFRPLLLMLSQREEANTTFYTCHKHFWKQITWTAFRIFPLLRLLLC